jgi:L-lactate dehydrogenase complex protein LldG
VVENAVSARRRGTTSDGRGEVLGRIRAALAGVPPDERPEDVAIPRAYRQKSGSTRAEIVARFVERVSEYRAAVHTVAESSLPEKIAEACRRRHVRRLAAPAGIAESWLPPGVEILRDGVDHPLSNEDLDAVDGVLTGCVLAIAETGTIVLDGGAGQGRRAVTLLPDYHLCVVFAKQIVGSVPEAISGLHAAVRDTRRPVTLISGPSATSDIELHRVEGVHGPRNLEVLVVHR